MGFRKTKDICAKTGSYFQDGVEKGRWENVGSLMQGDDGNHFILLKRTFNPAGVPVEPGKDQILLSMFDLKDGQQQPQQRQQQPRQQRPLPADDLGDFDPPF